MNTKEWLDTKSHWNKIYSKSETEKLGWYEQIPEPSFRLIDQCHLSKQARILNVGAGATTLVDELIKRGYQQLIATDISEVALENLKARIEDKHRAQVQWIVDDLTKPVKLTNIPAVDLWHDRAVLHFFLSSEEQKTYFDLVRKLVKPKGHVIIAVFNLAGAEKCSGLPVFRYSERMLADRLGEQFQLIKWFDYNYTMPSGAMRPYVYTLFKRIR
ncbi:MAG: class I SAM-dependent methyltransferase [Cyclobacteriaceae bacterium]